MIGLLEENSRALHNGKTKRGEELIAETQQLLREVLELPAVVRASLVDQLLVSLDRPDPEIDAVWRKEVEARIDAYEAGRIETVSMEEVPAKHLTR